MEFLIAIVVATLLSCLCTWAVSRWLDKRRAGRESQNAEWEADIEGAYQRGYRDGVVDEQKWGKR